MKLFYFFRLLFILSETQEIWPYGQTRCQVIPPSLQTGKEKKEKSLNLENALKWLQFLTIRLIRKILFEARQKFVAFEFLYKIYQSEVSTCDWNINANVKQKTFSITALFKFNESKARRTLGDPNFTNLSKTLKCSFKPK